MASVTFTISDAPDKPNGSVQCRVTFDPPVTAELKPEDATAAQHEGLFLVDLITKRAKGMTLTEIEASNEDAPKAEELPA